MKENTARGSAWDYRGAMLPADGYVVVLPAATFPAIGPGDKVNPLLAREAVARMAAAHGIDGGPHCFNRAGRSVKFLT